MAVAEAEAIGEHVVSGLCPPEGEGSTRLTDIGVEGCVTPWLHPPTGELASVAGVRGSPAPEAETPKPELDSLLSHEPDLMQQLIKTGKSLPGVPAALQAG